MCTYQVGGGSNKEMHLSCFMGYVGSCIFMGLDTKNRDILASAASIFKMFVYCECPNVMEVQYQIAGVPL